MQNFSEALAAREPSVNIAAGGGIAGAGATIRIRGSSSLSMSNEPVVYVDGVRIDNGSGFGAMQPRPRPGWTTSVLSRSIISRF